MTKRTCPWCGGNNLILTSCSGNDPKRHHASFQFWEDRECGYREKTSATEYYDYQKNCFVECEREVIAVHRPRPPLPEHQQPEYLRRSLPAAAPPGQCVLGGA